MGAQSGWSQTLEEAAVVVVVAIQVVQRLQVEAVEPDLELLLQLLSVVMVFVQLKHQGVGIVVVLERVG